MEANSQDHLSFPGHNSPSHNYPLFMYSSVCSNVYHWVVNKRLRLVGNWHKVVYIYIYIYNFFYNAKTQIKVTTLLSWTIKLKKHLFQKAMPLNCRNKRVKTATLIILRNCQAEINFNVEGFTKSSPVQMSQGRTLKSEITVVEKHYLTL